MVFSWCGCQVEYLRSRLFLTFFDVFWAEVHPVRRQKSRHVYNVGITNDVNVNPMSKRWWGLATRLESRLSRNVCEPVVGSVVKDSWWTNQERTVLPSFSKNTPPAMVVLTVYGYLATGLNSRIAVRIIGKTLHVQSRNEFEFATLWMSNLLLSGHGRSLICMICCSFVAYLVTQHYFRDCSQTLVRGAWCKKGGP